MLNSTIVGHIGGDDFIVILSSHKIESCAKAVLSQFSQKVFHLDGAEDLTVALAGLKVDADVNFSWSPTQVSEQAAHIKKEAKALGGNAFLLKQEGCHEMVL